MFRRELKSLQAGAGDAKVPPSTAPFDAEKVIREAYLRTLGRVPHEPEAAAARDYFDHSADRQKGLRDLLWALLNTKEFITNH